MRLGVLFFAALAALAVPSVAAARPTTAHDRDSARSARIVGTWNVQVTPTGAPAFAALLTLTPGGGVIETESDQPGTAQGAWKPISRNRFAIAFQTFIFTPAGPGGHVVVRAVASFTKKTTMSAPFKFDVFDPTGKVVQSGTGTATATRFVIPPL
jgi:hypothetical protein